VRDREREVRDRRGRREERGERIFFLFYDYIIHVDCNSGALYIRLYCSILMFREPYRESAVGCFL
jgi:hypothetical protein